jgi:membrane associated rhomboid family serine protease
MLPEVNRLSTAARSPRSDRFAGFRLVLAMAVVLWVAEIVDLVLGHRLDRYGIEPRDGDGLVGIVAAPLLHGGFGHLISNTVPFVAMGLGIALKGAGRVLAVTAIVALVSGVGTWLLGPSSSLHIGASGVVFGYATYLLGQGLFERGLVEVGLGLLVGAVWGGALLGGLLPEPGVSWQGHLFGAIGGVIAARMLSNPRPTRQPATA